MDKTLYCSYVGREDYSVGDIDNVKLNNLLFPMPPFTEQHRIVAKVKDLMALCDDLESKLSQGQSDSSRLVEAVVADLLVEFREVQGGQNR